MIKLKKIYTYQHNYLVKDNKLMLIFSLKDFFFGGGGYKRSFLRRGLQKTKKANKICFYSFFLRFNPLTPWIRPCHKLYLVHSLQTEESEAS